MTSVVRLLISLFFTRVRRSVADLRRTPLVFPLRTRQPFHRPSPRIVRAKCRSFAKAYARVRSLENREVASDSSPSRRRVPQQDERRDFLGGKDDQQGQLLALPDSPSYLDSVSDPSRSFLTRSFGEEVRLGVTTRRKTTTIGVKAIGSGSTLSPTLLETHAPMSWSKLGLPGLVGSFP